MVPGAASVGFVAPARDRKPLTQSCPSMTQRPPAGAHEVDERIVERLALVLRVVNGELLAGGLADREGHERVALGLDAPQHLPGEPALETVGLDEDEGSVRWSLAHPIDASVGSASAALPQREAACASSIREPMMRKAIHMARKKMPRRAWPARRGRSRGSAPDEPAQGDAEGPAQQSGGDDAEDGEAGADTR